MTETNSIFHVLSDMETSESDFISLLDRILKISVIMIKNVEELKEELGQVDGIIQIFVEDVDFNFWLEKNGTEVKYKKGINDEPSVEIVVTRKLMIQIMKREVSASDAYMKGFIGIKGNITLAKHLRNYMLNFARYMNAFQEDE